MTRDMVDPESRHEGSSFWSSLRTAVTGRRRSSRLPAVPTPGTVVTEARGALARRDARAARRVGHGPGR